MTLPRYQNFQIHSSRPQTDANQLDGTQGKGLFKFPLALEAVAIVGKTDGANADWDLELVLRNPADGSTTIFPLPEFSVTAAPAYFKKLNMDMPEASELRLKTSNVAGQNPTAQIVTKLLEERYK